MARERHDRLALGRLLEYLDRLDEAERCFAAAATDDGLAERDADRAVRAEALHWLAVHRRRSHRFQEAAEAWQALTEIPGVAADLRRDALEALAIHHEHRVKDLEAARAFALEALRLAADARRLEGVQHRLARLTHKLGRSRRSS
jgi:tetratricopeptide (TPR) repeat protein